MTNVENMFTMMQEVAMSSPFDVVEPNRKIFDLFNDGVSLASYIVNGINDTISTQ